MQVVIDDSMAQIHSHACTSLLHLLQIAIAAALTGDEQRTAERLRCRIASPHGCLPMNRGFSRFPYRLSPCFISEPTGLLCFPLSRPWTILCSYRWQLCHQESICWGLIILQALAACQEETAEPPGWPSVRNCFFGLNFAGGASWITLLWFSKVFISLELLHKRGFL